jgi:hypothetical protein
MFSATARVSRRTTWMKERLADIEQRPEENRRPELEEHRGPYALPIPGDARSDGHRGQGQADQTDWQEDAPPDHRPFSRLLIWLRHGTTVPGTSRGAEAPKASPRSSSPCPAPIRCRAATLSASSAHHHSPSSPGPDSTATALYLSGEPRHGDKSQVNDGRAITWSTLVAPWARLRTLWLLSRTEQPT